MKPVPSFVVLINVNSFGILFLNSKDKDEQIIDSAISPFEFFNINGSSDFSSNVKLR